MSQSLSSSFDSVIENFFFKPDNQSIIVHHATACESPQQLLQEIQSIKRSNIMLLLRLVIKELFKHRSKVTLTAECKVFFDHLFVCLENCLQHGLKPRRQMFGLKIDIWTVIELMGKYSQDAQDIIESVRHLPKIRTSLGRARAWFRLTMMKKKLSDSFQLFWDHRDSILREYYETNALMLSEDANVLSGLLVGLNSFDYSVYIKEEIFDFIEPVIDLRLYLRDNQSNDILSHSSNDNGINGEEINMQQLMDQNNYIEQVNQRLECTIKSLELKIDTLTAENMNVPKNETNKDKDDSKTLIEFGTILAEKEKQLLEEAKSKYELERKLQDEINLRGEAELARNLLETDIQEKQDTIISLRSQLEELKTINLQLFKRMQEKDVELKEKNILLAECESKANHLEKDLKQMETRISQPSPENLRDKEMLSNYQKLIDEQQEQMTQMQLELENVKLKTVENAHLQEAYNLLKKKYEENELALEEIGKQLQESKLEIESLREYNGHLKEAAWARDSEVDRCKQCEQKFTISRRKHHCRSCGEIFCHSCSNNEMPLPSSKKPVRVCDNCHAFLLERFSRTSSIS